ncbi:MAG: hypothetical protein MZV63_17430 [Marinilabiliales bacterium]|nr:hypothetical protein [Marinilabiliales bacterium]
MARGLRDGGTFKFIRKALGLRASGTRRPVRRVARDHLALGERSSRRRAQRLEHARGPRVRQAPRHQHDPRSPDGAPATHPETAGATPAGHGGREVGNIAPPAPVLPVAHPVRRPRQGAPPRPHLQASASAGPGPPGAVDSVCSRLFNLSNT